MHFNSIVARYSRLFVQPTCLW